MQKHISWVNFFTQKETHDVLINVSKVPPLFIEYAYLDKS